MKSIYVVMVYVCLVLSADLLVSFNGCYAQTVDPQTALKIALGAVAPVPPTSSILATDTPGMVAVAEVAAPPEWAADLLVAVQKLPVLGPIVGKIIMYAGVVSSILTALVATLLTILSTLSGIMNLAGLAGFAEKVQLFKNGKFMYWLTYLSMFNAKKPEDKAAVAKTAA